MLFIASFLFTILLISSLQPWARSIGLIDYPVGRKSHPSPTLLIGGLAIVTALTFLLSLLPILDVSDGYPPKLIFLIVALLVMIIIGLLDDMFQLSYKSLFGLQIISVLIVAIYGQILLTELGQLFGPSELQLGKFGMLFTIICFIGVMNAFNMIDGLDGLAGSVALVACLWFATIAHIEARPIQFALILILSGGLIAFLIFNMRFPWNKHARIFLGSAGSLTLGFIMTWSSIHLTPSSDGSPYPITMVYILGLPLMDMARVMIDRIRRGQSPFYADHSHLHHQLIKLGLTVNQVVAVNVLIAFLLGAIGVLGWYFSVAEYVLFYGFLLIMLAYFYVTIYAWAWIEKRVRVSRGLPDASRT